MMRDHAVPWEIVRNLDFLLFMYPYDLSVLVFLSLDVLEIV